LALGRRRRQHALLLRLFCDAYFTRQPVVRPAMAILSAIAASAFATRLLIRESQDRFHQFSQQFSPKTSGGARACLRNVIQIAFGI